MYLEIPKLNAVDDIQAEQLCGALRKGLLEDVSKTGGHLASNLGMVELTVALHRVFDFTRDRLIFDVGHQCYAHKVLSGRGADFDRLRTFGGLSGFPKPGESVQDAFIAGHASNSVSVALGMARARSLLGEDYHVVSIMGDGALTGGLAYEGLSNAGESGEPMLVILNDNGMSISENVGGVAQHLARQRLKPQYLHFKRGYRKVMSLLPGGSHIYRFTHKIKKAVKQSLLNCSLFEDMGFTYMGPVNGHDVAALTRLLRYIKDNLSGPVVLHVKTVKGNGYTHAESNPHAFHGVGAFDQESGTPMNRGGDSFSSVFGETLCKLAEGDETICAISAAMLPGTGLEIFARKFPHRCFDVGIAEGHAVSMASGMAKQGLKPVFAVYSTFLQRSYDMLLHDVAIQALPVVLAVDRAGLVGEDGETHHGLYDVAFLSSIPGMEIWSPAGFGELRTMLTHILTRKNHGPVAIRYPRGGELHDTADSGTAPSVLLREGTDLTLVTYGTMTAIVLEAADRLASQGISARVVKLNRITPIEFTIIEDAVRETDALLVVEEVSASGSVGERLPGLLTERGVFLKRYGTVNTGSGFVPQGTVSQLRTLCGLDSEQITKRAGEVCTRWQKNDLT